MRKWVWLAVLACGCSRNPGPGVSVTGAVAPRQAVIQFLNAVESQDLQAMSTVWGTSQGPARDQIDRSDLDKRLILMQSCFAHDRYQVVDEGTAPTGEHQVRVTLVRGARSRTVSFVTYQGPSDRYYMSVLEKDFTAIRDFCS